MTLSSTIWFESSFLVATMKSTWNGCRNTCEQHTTSAVSGSFDKIRSSNETGAYRKDGIDGTLLGVDLSLLHVRGLVRHPIRNRRRFQPVNAMLRSALQQSSSYQRMSTNFTVTLLSILSVTLRHTNGNTKHNQKRNGASHRWKRTEATRSWHWHPRPSPTALPHRRSPLR